MKAKLLDLFSLGISLSCALCSIIVTLFIFFILTKESIYFFKEIPWTSFFFETRWAPLFENKSFGVLSLLSGTLTTTVIALLLAIPSGTLLAIYLSEFCHKSLSAKIKSVLEVLSSIPTVVFGHFALFTVTPFLQKFIPNLPTFNMLSAGLTMGVMIIPFIASLSEEALNAVPQSLKEGAYAVGATSMQTSLRVTFPAALSGIISSYILAFSRAIGETMVVTIAAGMRPDFSFNPLAQGQTITSFIVQVSLGDVPHDHIGYKTLFAAGMLLFMVTLIFNILGYYLKKRLRQAYE